VRDSSFTCDGCIFEGATGSWGGAVSLRDDSGQLDVRIENSLFTGNRALYLGAAIYAISYTESGSVLILNSTITGNSTEGFGGGVWVSGPTVRIQSSTIVGNVANSNLSGGESGGGIAAGAGASVAMPTRSCRGISAAARALDGGCTEYTA
jgi:hypothetical protein